jgi:hypothetical protein
MHRSQQQQASDHSQYFPVPKSGQVLVRTYVLKYVEFLNVFGGMSGVLNLYCLVSSDGLPAGVGCRQTPRRGIAGRQRSVIR